MNCMVVVLCLKLLRDEVVMAFHICTYGRSPSHSQGLPEKQPFRPGVCKPSSWTKSALPPVCFLNLAAGIFREGTGTPLQYSCLENPMGGGAWEAAVHGVAKSRT